MHCTGQGNQIQAIIQSHKEVWPVPTSLFTSPNNWAFPQKDVGKGQETSVALLEGHFHPPQESLLTVSDNHLESSRPESTYPKRNGQNVEPSALLPSMQTCSSLWEKSDPPIFCAQWFSISGCLSSATVAKQEQYHGFTEKSLSRERKLQIPTAPKRKQVRTLLHVGDHCLLNLEGRFSQPHL